MGGRWLQLYLLYPPHTSEVTLPRYVKNVCKTLFPDASTLLASTILFQKDDEEEIVVQLLFR